MLTSFLFTATLFNQIGILGQDAHAGDVQTIDAADNWLILAHNPTTNHLAVKNIYVRPVPNLEEEEGMPIITGDFVDCGYAGMKDGQGVQLGVWDLKEGRMLQTWDVYKSGVSKEECTKDDEAKKQLTAAKDYYSKNGLDISKPLTEIKISKDNTFTIPKGESNVVLTAQKTVEKEVADDEMFGIMHVEVQDASKKVVYQKDHEFSKMMAGALKVSIPKVFVIGEQIIFVESHQFTSGRGDELTVGFTPLIALP